MSRCLSISPDFDFVYFLKNLVIVVVVVVVVVVALTLALRAHRMVKGERGRSFVSDSGCADCVHSRKNRAVLQARQILITLTFAALSNLPALPLHL